MNLEGPWASPFWGWLGDEILALVADLGHTERKCQSMLGFRGRVQL